MPNQPAAKDDPLRGKKSGKWSKHGGSVYGLVKEHIRGEWYCQTCGTKNPEELKPFLFEIFPGEFIRMCNLCTSLACQKITIVEITRIVRKKTLY